MDQATAVKLREHEQEIAALKARLADIEERIEDAPFEKLIVPAKPKLPGM